MDGRDTQTLRADRIETPWSLSETHPEVSVNLLVHFGSGIDWPGALHALSAPAEQIGCLPMCQVGLRLYIQIGPFALDPIYVTRYTWRLALCVGNCRQSRPHGALMGKEGQRAAEVHWRSLLSVRPGVFETRLREQG